MKKGDAFRRCLGCRGSFEKNTLLRLVLSPHNEIILDYYYKLPGRGAYVCVNPDCMERAFSDSALKRAFKGNVSGPKLEEMVDVIISKCTEKITSLLSMSMRSRNISLGTEAVEGELRRGNLSLLLLSGTLSKGARKQWEGKLAYKEIPIETLPEFDSINALLKGRKVVALRDAGLAQAIRTEIDRLKMLGMDSI